MIAARKSATDAEYDQPTRTVATQSRSDAEAQRAHGHETAVGVDGVLLSATVTSV